MGRNLYRERILDHYRNPRNHGRLDDPDVSNSGENPHCGDHIHVDIRLADDGETIERVAFTGEGCAISQAAASILTEELEGQTLAALREMDADDATDRLGVDLTPMRVKCAVLAQQVASTGVVKQTDD